MALVLLQPGIEPLGQFDYLSGQTYLGGEVLQFTTASLTGQPGAADNADGYLNPGTNKPVLTRNLQSGVRPLYLSDDGTTNYGTVLGAVVGGAVGTQVNNPSLSTFTGSFLGPATYLGSGRLTAWGKPGTYGVTLDACDTTVGGLQPTNATLVPGTALYAAKSSFASPGGGALTPIIANSFESNNLSQGLVVAYFIEFRTKGSLVTSPNRLVSALNSPSSVIGGVLTNVQYMAVFEWVGTASSSYYSFTGPTGATGA
jgi:hypothetical protein